MSKRIERQAAHWVIELDTTGEMETLRPTFETWLNHSPEHADAFNVAKEAWEAAEELRVFFIPGGPQLPPPPPLGRLEKIEHACGELAYAGRRYRRALGRLVRRIARKIMEW